MTEPLQVGQFAIVDHEPVERGPNAGTFQGKGPTGDRAELFLLAEGTTPAGESFAGHVISSAGQRWQTLDISVTGALREDPGFEVCGEAANGLEAVDMVARLERARAAGAKGVIATLDWSFSHARDWGSPKIPEKVDLKTIVTRMPEAVVRPRWFLEWARTMKPPPLSVPNMTTGAQQLAPGFFAAYGERAAGGLRRLAESARHEGVLVRQEAA